MESAVLPVIIPMWLTGFENLMPEGRAFPYKYLPRPGTQLSVTFGNPLPLDEIKKALGMGDDLSSPESTNRMENELNPDDKEKARIRAEVTAIIQRAVESLGRSVTRESLSQSR